MGGLAAILLGGGSGDGVIIVASVPTVLRRRVDEGSTYQSRPDQSTLAERRRVDEGDTLRRRIERQTN